MVIKYFKNREKRSQATQFEQLVGPHTQHLYQLAYRFCGQRADAEDLVQDVLLKLFPKTAELVAIKNIRPWLAKVLYRQFIDRTRQRDRSPLVLVDDLEHPSVQNSVTHPAEDKRSELEQTQQQLTQALHSLNPDQRAVVMLHDVEGYTLTELENMLDIPQGTLKSRLSRARTRLREILTQKEPFARE